MHRGKKVAVTSPDIEKATGPRAQSIDIRCSKIVLQKYCDSQGKYFILETRQNYIVTEKGRIKKY